MVTDVEVLTEDTAQVAAGKEDGARPPAADEDAFLAEMGTRRTDYLRIADAAEAGFTLAAMNLAFTRTEYTGIHIIPQPASGFVGLIHFSSSVPSVSAAFRALI